MANDERRTPRWLFDRLNEKFQFTVDAAASDENALVGNYWTKENDGLKQDWSGHTVWCNPPYSRGQLVKWVEKAAIDSTCYPGATTLMLLPADNSTVAGQAALRAAKAILFLDQRLAFDDEKSGAKFASWLVLFGGGRREVANLHLLDLGVVL
jgi:phage N-6-adenine-methyltransferase